MTLSRQTMQRRDRWAEWLVIALVVVALILGWALRGVILYRTARFTIDDAEISGEYPAGWVREVGSDPLLRLRDPLEGEFDAVLELRSRPLATEAEPVMVLDALSLERAGELVAYQTLSTDRVVVGEQVATRRLFTCVYVNRNPYVNQLPVVLQGVDLALRDEGRVIVATFLSDALEFDEQEHTFLAFVESLEY